MELNYQHFLHGTDMHFTTTCTRSEILHLTQRIGKDTSVRQCMSQTCLYLLLWIDWIDRIPGEDGAGGRKIEKSKPKSPLRNPSVRTTALDKARLVISNARPARDVLECAQDNETRLVGDRRSSLRA